ncbi:MAG: universal stress protein [Saprospiraceae bacterium]|nr:universal stress protein [Saprospiraceae bacterium]
MKNRFIVLIDFSEYSDNLIRYAYDWSIQANAELFLVHRTTILAPALTDIEAREQITRQTNVEGLLKLKALANDIIPSSVKVSYSVSERQLRFTLNSLLAEPFNNLIFTGISGTGLLKKVFLGSTAIKVINNTKNIVVAMPKEIAVYSHEKIFVAVTEQHPVNLLELSKFLNFIDRRTQVLPFSIWQLPMK